MDKIEFQWLYDETDRKSALQALFHCSGQHLKRYFSNKELAYSVRARDLCKLPLDFANHLLINPSYSGAKTFVLKEDQNILAVHKPSGIHCHPHCYSDQDTVLNALVEMGKWESLMVNHGQYDRGLLYRLDQETSGVLLLAKNETTFTNIRHHFEQEMKGKYYWALVDKGFDQEGIWTHYLRGTGVKGAKQKVSVEPHDLAQAATLEVKKVLENEHHCLVLVKLKTGLRHQIRAQLSALGFPIIGDELYGGKKGKRLFLHAFRYEWGNEFIEDKNAELFFDFLDLNRALQVTHDMLRIFKS